MRSEQAQLPAGQRILIAWFRYTVNGGIGRFLNVARVLNRSGHRVRFTSLTDETATAWPDFPGPILPFAEASRHSWDAVMIPGAGANDAQLSLLAQLRDPRFGVRVQHILNDVSRYPRFAMANACLSPDVVIFNNSHWRPADYRKLAASAFHVLPGAVDTDLFAPRPPRDDGDTIRRVGGFATKNLAPLLAALALLPPDHQLHLYGHVPATLNEPVAAWQRRGRLVEHGPIFGADLAAFYQELDLVVTTETQAGWCNTAAEAMASGVPCLVTPAGTLDFARHEETALVLSELSPASIAAGITRLTGEAALRRRLATAGPLTMQHYSWPSYANALLRLCQQPTLKSYFRMPELGLHGKWDPAVRLQGLSELWKQCRDATVLDLGAAEGIVAHEFVKRGARLVHGFELEPSRVAFARRLCARGREPAASFRTADLADWPRFGAENEDLLLAEYDIVLFLGLYHHLPSGQRRQSLLGALRRSRDWFAIRTPAALQQRENIHEVIKAYGFTLISQQEAQTAENLGWLGLFRRTAAA